MSTQFDEPPLDNSDLKCAAGTIDITSETTAPAPATQVPASTPTGMKESSIILKVKVSFNEQICSGELIPRSCETCLYPQNHFAMFGSFPDIAHAIDRSIVHLIWRSGCLFRK